MSGTGREAVARWTGGRRALELATVGALLLSGCGIRATTVPVDAGAAPTRSACTLSDGAAPSSIPEPQPESTAADSLVVDVKVLYLVCNGQVDHVVRKGTIVGSRTDIASSLLQELGRAVTREEADARYESVVPSPLEVDGPREDDPDGTLRLDVDLDGMQPFALGQIVCTLAHTLGGEAGVRLGGPGQSPVRSYVCDTRMRTDPAVGPDVGAAD